MNSQTLASTVTRGPQAAINTETRLKLYRSMRSIITLFERTKTNSVEHKHRKDIISITHLTSTERLLLRLI